MMPVHCKQDCDKNTRLTNVNRTLTWVGSIHESGRVGSGLKRQKPEVFQTHNKKECNKQCKAQQTSPAYFIGIRDSKNLSDPITGCCHLTDTAENKYICPDRTQSLHQAQNIHLSCRVKIGGGVVGVGPPLENR